jgi:5-methylcytosine-specific restriction endonuclease McrA
MGTLNSRRPRRQIAKTVQVIVFRRDRWLCHLCKRPVIFAPAMKYLQHDLEKSGFAELAYWRFAYHRHGAPLLDELAVVIDHIEVFSTGGLDVAENLATACNRCNMTRNSCELKKWLDKRPIKRIKGKYGEPETWDGFSSVFLHLAKRYAHELTASEIEWAKALTQRANDI